MPKRPTPERFTGLVRKCDCELSIEARRILRKEAHCSSDCIEFIWQPTQDFLEQLAKQKPKFLLCSRNKPFSPNQNEEQCIDVDIINPVNWKSAYLGMVVNVKQAITAWTRLVQNCFEKANICFDALQEKRGQELFSRYMDRLEKLIASGPMTILRENVGCLIPVEADNLSRRATEKGVKKLISALMPELAGLPIRWAPANEQEAFERFVAAEAAKRAKPQTEEECLAIYSQDVE